MFFFFFFCAGWRGTVPGIGGPGRVEHPEAGRGAERGLGPEAVIGCAVLTGAFPAV